MQILQRDGTLRDAEQYQLVWHDEFDAAQLDRNVWTAHYDMGHGEHITETFLPKNLRLENSRLIQTALREPGQTPAFSTSATISTYESMNYQYGYLELAAQAPYKRGSWPAFWLKSNEKYRAADYLTEIDVFEVFARLDEFSTNLHKWRGKDHDGLTESWDARTYKFRDASNLNNEFHTYGFEWTPEEMAFYIDGKRYYSFDITEAGDFGETIKGMRGFHDPMYVILDNFLFVPGLWWEPGPPYMVDEHTEFPIVFQVDSVRLYQKPGCGRIIRGDTALSAGPR